MFLIGAVALIHAAVLKAADRRDLLPCPAETFFGDYYRASPASPERRREFARMLLRRLEKLENAVPELSPAEREWLAGELTKTGRRNLTASDSIQNQKFTARMFIGKDLPLLRRLSSDGLALREEVNLWALVAENYEDYGYARAIGALVDANVIEAEFAPYPAEGLSTGDMLDFICRGQARQIMFPIVQPYLGGTLRR
jgi:hypothetical protein